MRVFNGLDCLARVLLLLLSIAAIPHAAAAQSLTIAWDRSPSPDVAGYIVYVGNRSGAYTQSINVGNNTTFTMSNAQMGSTYYFAVGAYGSSSRVSGLSNEVSGSLASSSWAPSPTPAYTSTPDGTSSTTGAISLAWDRSPSANVRGYIVYIGEAPHSYTQSINVGNNTAFTMTNAQAGRTYYFAVESAASFVGPYSITVYLADP